MELYRRALLLVARHNKSHEDKQGNECPEKNGMTVIAHVFRQSAF